ncbi:MAG: retention module-containing protein [Gallionella sp.]|nr:retention module-containing protein [Gallionella sp.]
MPVAKATNVKGKITATNAKCEVRTINEGDLIEEGEVVRTGEGASVGLELMMGGVVSLEAKQTVTVDKEFFSAIIPDARDSALSLGGGDFNSIISAIREGTGLDGFLEETAAGLASGSDVGSASSGGGAGFVMLAGVVETISQIPAVTVDYSLNRGPVAGGNTFAAAQALAAIQATAHTAAIQAAANNAAVVDTSAPVITLDPSAGVNAPITGTVTDTGGTVSTVQVTVANIATGIATTATIPVQDNGAFTAPAPTGTGTYTVTVTAIDTAGNVSTVGGTTDNTVVVDTTAPLITLDPSAGVNAPITGTVTDAGGTVGTVQVTVTDTATGAATTTTVPVQTNGAFTAPAPTDTGTYTVTVTAIDTAGNVSTVGGAAANTVVVDTIAIASITVDTVAGDDIVNAAEAGGTVAVTGSVGGDAGAGDTVTLIVGDSAYTGFVGADNTYSISIPGSILAVNTNIGVSVTAVDVNGNIATATAAHGYSVDTTATASITVNAITADNVINATEKGGTVAITGSVGGDSKAGDVVILTVGDNTYTGTVAANGTYNINVPGATLAANTSIGVSVTGIDANGNTATATASHGYAVDISPPTVTISTDDGLLTAGEMAHLTFTLSEASDSFTAAAITVSGGTLTDFAGSGTSYIADFIPTPNSTAPATVTVTSGSFADAMGNYNESESTLNMSVNTVIGETLRGSHGDDTLVGGAGNDMLFGEQGKDHLEGGSGNDTLYGGQGKDTLKGGLGNDLLYGGEGKDIFAWSPADVGAPGNPAVDTIADFDHENDRIDLNNLLDGVVGDKNDVGNLLSYINISKEGSDTVLRISSQGNFENGEYHPSKEDQTIVIKNVDLTVKNGEHDEHGEHGGRDEHGGHDEHGGYDVDQAATLLKMLQNGNLNVNTD